MGAAEAIPRTAAVPSCAVGPQTAAELDAFGRELDALGARARASLGAREARYIRRLLWVIRFFDAGGRILLLAAVWAWSLPLAACGTVLLGLAKVLQNMEFGHNVMHGQYDWLNDRRFDGPSHEWDNVCSKEDWREFHNHVHHHYTNVLGIDRDFGYGFLRLSADQPWEPRYLWQPIYVWIVALFFEWAIAIHNLEFERLRTDRAAAQARIRRLWPRVRAKMWRQFRRDYLVWPALGAMLAGSGALVAGGSVLPAALLGGAWVMLGHVAANAIRNLWSFMVIFCGHFPTGVLVFDASGLQGETRGGWYLRQVLGSGNVEGGWLFHVLSGNLSHQIEHHLFPDLPACRYGELAPEVRRICAAYNVPYQTGSLARQFGSVWLRIVRYAFPGGVDAAVKLDARLR